MLNGEGFRWMLRVAVVDDEITQVRKIGRIVFEYFKRKQILASVECFESGEKFLEQSISYDIIFLDIQMEGIDGIETANNIRMNDKRATMIYVSNYSEKMALSFTVHPFSFIVKPVDSNKICSVLDDYMEYIDCNNRKEELLFVLNHGGSIKIFVDTILYFEYIGNRIIRMITTETNYEIIENISSLTEQIGKYGFISPHKSFIVNEAFITSFKDDILINGKYSIPIAKNKKKLIHEKIIDYMHQHLMD